MSLAISCTAGGVAGRLIATPNARMTTSPASSSIVITSYPESNVSITEHDGVMRTFRIIWVRDL
jgi:hypothetical protein